MINKTLVIISSVMLLIALTASPLLAAKEDVTSRLTALKVEKQKDGKESLVKADKVKPGDVVQYDLVYTNSGAKGVKNLIATLPIPKGMEFLPDTAKPDGALASTDGKTYLAMPLTRTVKLKDGKTAVVNIPCAEYRFLLWKVGSLAAGKSAALHVRVQVSAGAVTPKPK